MLRGGESENQKQIMAFNDDSRAFTNQYVYEQPAPLFLSIERLITTNKLGINADKLTLELRDHLFS